MNILLLNPPRSMQNAIFEHAPESARPFARGKLVGPPLGLITVAAAVPDHAVVVLDLKGEADLCPDGPGPEALLQAALRDHAPDLVGVTVIASELPAALTLLAQVKRERPQALTVAGGLHAQLCPEDLDHPAVDLVYIDPLPQPFARLVATLDHHGDPAAVPGVLGRRGDRLVGRPSDAQPSLHEADGFRPPARHLLDRWQPTYRVGRAHEPFTYLFTSLGCPGRCRFCSIWPGQGGTHVRRDVDSLVAELGSIHDVDVVRFADANTTADLPFVHRLCEAIEAAGIRKRYVMDMRVDTACENPALVERLARLGLKAVITGFEAHSDEELRRYHKGITTDQIARALDLFHRLGIQVRANYLVRPDFSFDEFEALAAFARRHAVSFAGYLILTPMPGTALHTELFDQIVDFDLSRYNFFNCVLKSRLPLDEFYRSIGRLWPIRLSDEIL